MGIVRTLLAFLVFCAHLRLIDSKATILWLTGGADMAVNTFFLLSGFYMTLVLENKYKNNTLSFFKNRAIRLYPLYWAVALVSLFFYWSMQYSALMVVPNGFEKFYVSVYKELSYHIKLIAVVLFQNITFIGLDFNRFFCAEANGSISLLTNQCTYAPLGAINLVPQAWSLGVECLFYLIIPFVLKGGNKAIWSVLIGTAIFNAVLPYTGIEYPNTRYIFFLSLIYFMLGVVSFKLYNKVKDYLPGKIVYLPLVVIFISLILGYTYYFDYGYYNFETRFWFGINPGYYLLLFLLVPLLFHASKNSKFDNFLGEFSYPIYITHNTVGFTLALTLKKVIGLNITNDALNFAYYLGCIVLISVISYLAIVRPIDLFRARSKKNEYNALALSPASVET